MTLASNANVQRDLGDGASKTFTVPYRFFADGDLVVLVADAGGNDGTPLTLGPDYTVSGAGNPDGGSVTLAVAPAAGRVVTRARKVMPLQTANYVENDQFPAEVHEAVLDKLTAAAQDTRSMAARAPMQPLSDTSPIGPLPSKALRASKVAIYDAAGDPGISDLTVDEMETQAGAAAASAAAALVSQNASHASEVATAGSAAGAATSAANAGTSEANALTYKNAAGVSAAGASISEANALTYKNAAGVSATNAGTSETNALAYKNAAGVSATNAGTSETNALASKNAAAASATSASTYAAALQATSTSSLAIATGSKIFTTQSGKQFAVGQFVLCVDQANTANYMYGQVSSYAGTTLTVAVSVVGGAGTIAAWNIYLSGVQGPAGAATWGAITGTLSAQSDLNTALTAKLASASFTAAAVLALLLTVDGAGSGLDADTIDGINSTSLARLDANGALVGAGFTTTAANDGTVSSGTYTPTPNAGNLRRYINGGAHTFAAPSVAGDYTLAVLITNSATAGAVTFSGFNKVEGATLTTTSGSSFYVLIEKINGVIIAQIAAAQ